MTRNLFLASLLGAALVEPASAQDQVRIRFAPGASGATINGTITGREYVDYVLSARGGQMMAVSLRVTGTNGNGTIHFNILPAGQDYPALFVGSSEGHRAEVVLPRDGDWAIRTYLMGNDYDTGKTVGYSINVRIPSGGGGEDTTTADDGGGAMAGSAANPAFWRVRVNTSLNVHGEPSTASPTFFRLPNGSVVRNLGCQPREGRLWCQVPTGPTDGASIGWVAAEFLVPAAAPAGGVNAVIPSVEESATAEDGGGAMAGRSGNTVRVQFAPGTTGAEMTGKLMPQASRRYVLRASDGQVLYFRLAANGPGMTYVVYNPDGSILLDEMVAARDYRGQLWQSGDHIVEVYNTSNGAQSYNVIFGIE